MRRGKKGPPGLAKGPEMGYPVISGTEKERAGSMDRETGCARLYAPRLPHRRPNRGEFIR